jgi:transposase
MTSNSNGKPENVKNQVIILLLSGMSVDAISRQLDVSDKTIQTWLKQSDFKKTLIESSEVINTVTMSRIISLNKKAIDCLTDLLDDSSDKVKLAAIKIVLDSTNKWLDRDTVNRLKELESLSYGLKNDE